MTTAKLVIAGALAALAACNAPHDPGQPTGPDAGVVAGDAAADGGSGSGSATNPYPAWGVMDSFLGDMVAGGVTHGYAIQIFDAGDHLVYSAGSGNCVSAGECPAGSPAYTPDLVTGVASSTKWVTSTTALAAFEEQVAAGTFTSLDAALDTPISSLLTCPGGIAASVGVVTPRQLLSFTDGLLPEHACVGVATYNGAVQTLETCACAILADSAAARVATATAGSPTTNAQPPGSVYKYGDAHLTIVGAIVERMDKEPWANVFARLVASKISVPWVYGPPDSLVNPNLAGSIRSSVADYAKFVAALFHDRDGLQTLLSPAALAEQETSQLPAGVDVRIDPLPGLDYGFNNWRYCYETPFGEDFLMEPTPPPIRAQCDQSFAVGHAGKGGYNPWIDMTQDFYAVYAMREASPGNDGNSSYAPAEITLTANVRLLAQLIMNGELATP